MFLLMVCFENYCCSFWEWSVLGHELLLKKINTKHFFKEGTKIEISVSWFYLSNVVLYLFSRFSRFTPQSDSLIKILAQTRNYNFFTNKTQAIKFVIRSLDSLNTLRKWRWERFSVFHSLICMLYDYITYRIHLISQ